MRRWLLAPALASLFGWPLLSLGGCGSSGDASRGLAAAGVGSTGVAVGGQASLAGGGAGGTGPEAAAGATLAGRAGATGSAGTTSAGATTGGEANGGNTSAGAANGGKGGDDKPPGAAPAITKSAEAILTNAGTTIVSFGGYLNGESFQQEGLTTFNGYQYATWWNTARHVVLARRALPSGAWSALEFTDYTNTEADAHNTISIGICAADGTIHLAFDHHVSPLHYRSSVAGVATTPAASSWTTASFSAITDRLVAGTKLSQLTYPRFVSEPGGSKLLFEARVGSSGSGDQYLWEYDSQQRTWASLGKYVDGIGDSINAYPHGLSYDKAGRRLHLSWCWRETPEATSNHDLLYVYSDDNGRTWLNNAGTKIATTGASFVKKSSAGLKVWTIDQNRGLLNTEHMAVDGAGRVHVLLAHLPDAEPSDTDFDRARTKSRYFHYLRSATGVWSRSALELPSVANFRGKLAVSANDNVYAILPDLRIAASSASSNYETWKLLDDVDAGRFFSDPLIDSQRLQVEDKLTILYPQKASANIYVLDYSVQ